MRKEDVFIDIVSTLQKDYSGFCDKKGWDQPERYQPDDQLSDDEFVSLVQDYLLDYKDLHIGFRLKGSQGVPRVGFLVRRYEERLYVTESVHDDIQVGDVITKVDGASVKEIVQLRKRELIEELPEREDWSRVLAQAEQVELRDETVIRLEKAVRDQPKPIYQFEKIDSDTGLLTLTDFLDADAVISLLDQVEATKKLIIDVRKNKGGSDLAYYPLLPYLFHGDTVELETSEVMLTNCTERNVRRRVQLMESIKQHTDDEKTCHKLDILIGELKKHTGKGFVELDLSDLFDSSPMKTKKGPEQVVILTDVSCGSSGDSFVETCKRSEKVTVLGRATKGLNDYANVAMVTYADRFEFWYPTSRLSRIDEGKGMSGVGILPDVHIPWTPEHLEQDVDLEHALKLL